MNIRILRPFYAKGERLETGSTADLERTFARQMIVLGKAELAEEPQPTELGPMTSESATGLVQGRRRKSNAEHSGN